MKITKVKQELGILIIRCRYQIGLISAHIIRYAIHTLLVSIGPFEREIGSVGCQRPDFDGSVKGTGGEGVGVLRVEGDGHDVVFMAFKNTSVNPVLREGEH